MMPAVIAPEETAPLRTLSPHDELRAQYVACSYLASACQDALGRFPPPSAGPSTNRLRNSTRKRPQRIEL